MGVTRPMQALNLHALAFPLHVQSILQQMFTSCELMLIPKAPVTLSRLGGRPLPTLMVWKGRLRSVGGRERAVAGLVRS